MDIANPRKIAARLDADEKDTLQIAEGTAGNPNVTIVTEPGLYAVILQSRKPIARRFDRWRVHAVRQSET
jgi:anti-repressor protein